MNTQKNAIRQLGDEGHFESLYDISRNSDASDSAKASSIYVMSNLVEKSINIFNDYLYSKKSNKDKTFQKYAPRKLRL